MEDRDQSDPGKSARRLCFTCPACKRRVCVWREAPSKLPRFFPFCSERCKMIDLGAWLDAEYRIPSKPDEEFDHPSEGTLPSDPAEAHQ